VPCRGGAAKFHDPAMPEKKAFHLRAYNSTIPVELVQNTHIKFVLFAFFERDRYE
jgi:hypothetical protein